MLILTSWLYFNLESSITPDQFAEITCEDLRLPVSVFSPLIANSIRDQIQEYFLNASSMISDSQDDSTNAYEEFVKYKKQKLDTNVTIEEKLVETEETATNKMELRTLIKVSSKTKGDRFTSN